MTQLLVIDNYDSFTYNLVHYLEKIMGQKVEVKRNDALGLDEVEQYSHLVLSPGPGLPKDAGIMPAIIQKYASTKHILGICLGHQALAEAFGAHLYNLDEVYHGVAGKVEVNTQHYLFRNLPKKMEVGRYHSWAVKDLPECFEVTARGERELIMGIAHKQYNLVGVQFHPESILTPNGYTMLENWVRLS